MELIISGGFLSLALVFLGVVTALLRIGSALQDIAKAMRERNEIEREFTTFDDEEDGDYCCEQDSDF